MATFAFSPVTVVFVLLLGVLFFGKDLPDVARKLGSQFKDLKKGLDEFNSVKRDVVQRAGLDKLDVSLGDDPLGMEETVKQVTQATKFEPPASQV